MSKFWNKLSDITHLHKRAAFSDLPERIAAKESVFMGIAKGRFSCRKFKDTPLTEVQIKHILEAARLAPSAKNNQPVHVWVVKSEEALSKLKSASNYLYDAPAVFMVGYNPEEAWVRKSDGKNGGDIDAAIVGTHIILETYALGLGSVWVGSFDPAAIKAAFPETTGYEIVALFPVGTPDAEDSPNHGKRKPLEGFASEL